MVKDARGVGLLAKSLCNDMPIWTVSHAENRRRKHKVDSALYEERETPPPPPPRVLVEVVMRVNVVADAETEKASLADHMHVALILE